jgi:hypothetical protein
MFMRADYTHADHALSEGFSVLAQSLVEYGALSSIITAAGDAAFFFSEWVSSQPPAAWFVLGAGALVVLRYLLRRRGV